MIERLRRRILAIIDAVETMPMSMGKWLLVLGSIIVIRHFLEIVSGRSNIYFFTSYLIHFPVAYLAPLLGLVVVLTLMSGERVERVSRLMLFAWLLTLLPPTIDLLLGGGASGESIGYLLVDPSQLRTAFVNLLNPFSGKLQGTTAGIRVEAAVGCLAGAVYVHLKTRKLGRSVLTLLVTYVTMFFFFTLPVEAVTFTRLFAPTLQGVRQLFYEATGVQRGFEQMTMMTQADFSISLLDLYIIVPLLAVVYRLFDRDAFRATVRSMAPVQLTYHVLLTFVGLVLGTKLLTSAPGLLYVGHPFDVYSLLGVLAASFFAALTAQTLGRLHASVRTGGSEPADRRLRNLLGTELAIALLLAYVVSFAVLTYVLAFLAVYYVYYATPVRLSRFPGLSSLLLGVASLFSLELGFCAYSGAAAPLWIPRSVVAIVVLVPTLALLAKDAWPTAPRATSAANRWGLTELVGPSRARAIGWVAGVVAALLPAIILRIPALLIPGVIAGTLFVVTTAKGTAGGTPGLLLTVMALFLLAAFGLHAVQSPVIKSDLAATTFFSTTAGQGTTAGATAAPESDEFKRLLSEAARLFQAGNYADAADLFERALEIDPNHVAARVILGQTLRLLGDTEGALRQFTRATELDPKSARGAYGLALVYRDKGDAGKELEQLKLAASLDPANGDLSSELGDAYVRNRMYEEAIAAYTSALGAKAPPERIHAKLSDAYSALGNLESAEKEIRQEIELSPDAPLMYEKLAGILKAEGRLGEAKAALETAIVLAKSKEPALKARLENELRSLTRP